MSEESYTGSAQPILLPRKRLERRSRLERRLSALSAVDFICEDRPGEPATVWNVAMKANLSSNEAKGLMTELYSFGLVRPVIYFYENKKRKKDGALLLLRNQDQIQKEKKKFHAYYLTDSGKAAVLIYRELNGLLQAVE